MWSVLKIETSHSMVYSGLYCFIYMHDTTRLELNGKNVVDYIESIAFLR